MSRFIVVASALAVATFASVLVWLQQEPARRIADAIVLGLAVTIAAVG
jgi:hypothetical protein